MRTTMKMLTVLRAAAGGGVALPTLDNLTTALTVSTRKLHSEYAGNCMLLRRSSDDAEQAFGFNSQNMLDTAAISAWGGDDTLFVKTWYDQSGGGNDANQATAANQPTLVLNEKNGLAIVRFGSQSRLAIPLTIGKNVPALHAFAVVKYPPNKSGGGNTILGINTGTVGTAGRFTFGGHFTSNEFTVGGRRLDADSLALLNGGKLGDLITTKWVVQEGLADYANSNLFLRVNNVEQNRNLNFQTNGNTSNTDSLAAFIGDNNNSFASALRGDLGEIILAQIEIAGDARLGLLSNINQTWGFVDGLAGAWTWFNDPRAIALGDDVLTGVVDERGCVDVAVFDTETGGRSAYLLSRSIAQIDDHNNPSFLIRNSDSKILCFYTGHNVPNMYLRISTNAQDASAWDAEVDLAAQLGTVFMSYTNPIQLTGEANEPIYLFYRGAPSGTDWTGYYTKSEDGGETWSAAVNWIDNAPARPYWRFVRNGTDRIDFIVASGSPPSTSPASVYAGYYQGGSWYKLDGTLVGDEDDMPFAPSDFTLIHNGLTVKGWVWDIAIGADGHPRYLYTTYPTLDNHRYNYARWTGTELVIAEICEAGGYLYADETYYSGGITFDHSNPNVVIASRESGGNWNIWRYTTSDDGVTWAGIQLTGGGGKKFRPVIVRGATGEPKLLYVEGTYTSYTNYDTKIALRSSSSA
jgi:hypothetical protein